MNNNSIVSIVVTIFNIHKYIDRCIKSLVRQTYKNIQVILVDDGSNDGSSTICDEWAKKDERIEVIHKRNGGLSDARNYGFKHAKGTFICFVDGDDYVEDNMIETSYQSAIQNSADMVIFSNYIVYSNGQKKIHHLHAKKNIYSESEIMGSLFDECIGSLPNNKTDYDIGFSPWGRLYKRSNLLDNNIKFKSERVLIYEDLMFLLDSLPAFKKAVVLDKPLYNYCLNEDSLTHKADPNRFKKIKYQYNYLKNHSPYKHEIFENKISNLRFKRTMIGYVRNAITRIIENDKYAYQNIKKINSDDFCQELLKKYPTIYLPKKQFIFAFLLKHKWTTALYFIMKIKSKKDN